MGLQSAATPANRARPTFDRAARRMIPAVRPSVVHITSNGWGMGHLSRQVAIALAAEGRASSAIMSMSGAVPVVQQMGVPIEYCPSNTLGWIVKTEWHAYLRDRIVALCREREADVIVFDGVAPYPGIGRARPMLPDVMFVWMRRGMWIPGANDHALARSTYFDLIIEPGDLAGVVDVGPTADRHDAVRVSPVSMLERVPMVSRAEAASALGLDPDRPTILVTLGTGRLGDVLEPGRVVLETVTAGSDWQVCLTKPAIAEEGLPIPDPERVIELTNVYPLVRYLNAFDAAVSASGYNAVHELLPAAIPTLFVPSPRSVTDDQAARARWAADQGCALVADADRLEDVESATRALLSHDTRRDLRARCAGLGVPSGAGETIGEISRALTTFDPGPRREGPDDPGPGPRLRWQVQRLIGPTATSVVRWLTGRQHLRPDLDRRSVDVDGTGDSRLVFGHDISIELLRSGAVVEHLVPGSSSGYRAARRSIVGRYYDVDVRWVALER